MIEPSVYHGFSKDYILKLCENKNLKRFFLPSPYWTSELYSKGLNIRKYSYYPSFLPICAYTSHGVGEFFSPLKHELESDAPVQFFSNPDAVKRYKKQSNKKCYVIYSPEVFYRESNKIIQFTNAKGTLAFPVHSTPDCDEISNKENYIQQLKSLPPKYQPVVVCLHYHDINKGLHKIFIKHGIPVVTAGNTSDYRFIKRLYHLLRHFKYTTSNGLISACYYSIEMGIPFFTYGIKEVFFNRSDNSIPKGIYNSYKKNKESESIYKLFSKKVDSVTKKQREVAEYLLGLNHGLSRTKMSLILYYSFIKWLFSRRFFYWFKDSFHLLLKNINL